MSHADECQCSAAIAERLRYPCRVAGCNHTHEEPHWKSVAVKIMAYVEENSGCNPFNALTSQEAKALEEAIRETYSFAIAEQQLVAHGVGSSGGGGGGGGGDGAAARSTPAGGGGGKA